MRFDVNFIESGTNVNVPLSADNAEVDFNSTVIENLVVPTASVSKTGSVSTLVVHDINQTTTVEINDGEKGDKGDTGDTGPKGDTGATGTTFTPSVSDAGIISWTNDGGKENPASKNIKGPKGDDGITPDMSNYYTKSDVNSLLSQKAGVDDIPTTLSELTNDTGFIDNTVNNLINYYKKTETYTKVEVQTLIDSIKQFTYELVSVLPTASASTMNKIYLVPSTHSATANVKDEFITIESSGTYSWEQIGSTTVDLSNYYTKQETYNKTEVNTELAKKIEATSATLTDAMPVNANTLENHPASYFQPKLTAGTNITIANNVISASGGGGSQLYAHYMYISWYFGASWATIINDSVTSFNATSLCSYLYNNNNPIRLPITGRVQVTYSGTSHDCVAGFITCETSGRFLYAGYQPYHWATGDSEIALAYESYSWPSSDVTVTDRVVEL